MDKILTLLQNLFSLQKVASVTLPGLISAGALAYLMRPTLPQDFIPSFEIQVTDVNAKLESCRKLALPGILNKREEEAEREYLRNCLPPLEPVCKPPQWNGGQLATKPLKLVTDSPFSERRRIKEENQQNLEEAKQEVAYCMNVEQNWQGIESIQNDMLKNDISFYQKELSAAQDSLLAQEKVNGLFLGQYRSDMLKAQNEINIRRNRLIYNEQSTNNRKANLAELKRIDDLITARLGDPGRLRPLQPFDEYLSALASHIVALVLLAIALGVIIDPLSQSITTASFDAIFKRGF